MTNLETARRARKWTQAQLGKRARVPQPMVSAIENGRMQPWPGHAARLAKALGIAVDELTQDASERGLMPAQAVPAKMRRVG